MPKAHAKLSPSAAARWINCPGSIALSGLCPPPGSTSYADEGTAAHSLAELKLRKYLGELTGPQYTKAANEVRKSGFFDGEMEETTELYKDRVLEELAAAGDDAELMVEQHFKLDRWVPDCFGTSDAVVIGGDTINVIDLKYGKGIKVEAEGNPQLRLYGLGAAGLFGDIYDFSKVRMTIIQPRLDHVSSEELPLADLLKWAEDVVVPAAKLCGEDDAPLACGDWCRFCPGKAICRKRAEYNLELAKEDFKLPKLLTDDEIGDVLRRAEQLSSWVKDVSDYALKEAESGKHFNGWKLVEGRANRKYADEIKVAKALKAAGFQEAVIYEKRLLGLTAMAKVVGGDKKLTGILNVEGKDPLIVKPKGAPTLVPESDKRPTISSAAEAANDFKEEAKT